MPELKASRLIKSGRGRALIKDIFERSSGRFAVNAHDKLVALCGWIFEYIYEPVYQRDPSLLYKKNFNRFIAMFSWLWFNEVSAEAQEEWHSLLCTAGPHNYSTDSTSCRMARSSADNPRRRVISSAV